MAVERRPISVSQFCELMGVEPSRLRNVEWGIRHFDGRRVVDPGVVLVLEPENANLRDVQTTGGQHETPSAAKGQVRRMAKKPGSLPKLPPMPKMPSMPKGKRGC